MPLFASIRGPERTVNRLTIDGNAWGWAALVSQLADLEAPYGYLAYDVTGKSTKVTFRRGAGPGVRSSIINGHPSSSPSLSAIRAA